MQQRQAPTCDWCGAVAPAGRRLHPVRIQLGQFSVCNLELCLPCCNEAAPHVRAGLAQAHERREKLTLNERRELARFGP
jgi:hypothetical protein